MTSVLCVQCRGFYGWTNTKLGDTATVESMVWPVSVMTLPANGDVVTRHVCGSTRLMIAASVQWNPKELANETV